MSNGIPGFSTDLFFIYKSVHALNLTIYLNESVLKL